MVQLDVVFCRMRFGCLMKILEAGRHCHRPDGNSIYGVLRQMWQGPRVWRLRRGDESEEGSDGVRGEKAPARCVVAVVLRGSQREVQIQ